jgi:hypothetical protein
MKYNLQKIDELYLSSYKYLTSEDECYFFMNYTPPVAENKTTENSHIMNFKKKMHRKGMGDWHYKQQAISEISDLFINNIPPIIATSSILVPVPPSIAKGDLMYDDRLVQLVSNYCKAKKDVEFREIVTLADSMTPTHEDEKSPEELMKLLEVDTTLIKPLKDQIVVIDDVLRHGAHYKAIKNLLQPHFPSSQIIGLYIARTLH